MATIKKGWVEINVKKLTKAKWNYKESDSDKANELMEKLEKNFEKNGQIENIIVRDMGRGKYEVVNGNHRYDVAKKLKLEKMMCYNLGKIKLADAKRIAIETNETKFDADQIKLAEALLELDRAFGRDDLIETMPFNEIDFDRFERISEVEDDENGASSSSSDEKSGDGNGFRVVKFDLPKDVADQLTEQVDRFKKLLYPNDKPSNVSYIMPIEAMMQSLVQIPDENILGDEF